MPPGPLDAAVTVRGMCKTDTYAAINETLATLGRMPAAVLQASASLTRIMSFLLLSSVFFSHALSRPRLRAARRAWGLLKLRSIYVCMCSARMRARARARGFALVRP